MPANRFTQGSAHLLHTHFPRDDARITTFLDTRKAVGQAGWNKELAGKEQTLDDRPICISLSQWTGSLRP
jgi:hypothetical protein